MLDQTSDIYQNAATIVDISAMTKHNESKTQATNDYRQTNVTEESKEEMCDSDTEAAEEERLKPPDTEWSLDGDQTFFFSFKSSYLIFLSYSSMHLLYIL